MKLLVPLTFVHSSWTPLAQRYLLATVKLREDGDAMGFFEHVQKSEVLRTCVESLCGPTMERCMTPIEKDSCATCQICESYMLARWI